MRKIDPGRFQIATQGTSREINRRIVLNLVRTHQPISRADLARTMGIRRGAVSLIVSDLLGSGLIVEGATGEAVRGRKPTFLYIDSRRRTVVAVDVRASQTFLMLADLLGKPLGSVVSFPTPVRDPKQLARVLAEHIRLLLGEYGGLAACEGVGIVIPGMIEHPSMRVIHAPTLGWHNVDLLDSLVETIGLPVQMENSGRACAVGQLWAMHGGVPTSTGDLVFVSVSDGLGVGAVIHGELLRGRHNTAGEFGHMPLSLEGPRCSCGAFGCWEAYVSNRATVARYFGRPAELPGQEYDESPFGIDDVIACARDGDVKARNALRATGRYLGTGIAAVVNVLDPTRVFIGGEIICVWDLIEADVREAMAARALTPSAAATELQPVATSEHPRLRGAAALVTAPAFAAPVVA